MAVDVGTLGKLGIHTASPVTASFDFVSENLVMNEGVINANGVRGTRDQSVERLRAGNQVIAGTILLRPTPVELALLLPWMLGGTPSGSGPVSYPIAETLTTRFVAIDRISKVFTYAGCGVDSFTIRGRQGEPMEVELNLVAQTETIGNAGTFPALTIDTTTAPYVFTDMVFNLNAVANVLTPEFDFTMNNMIDKDRFFNSRTLTAVTPLDRETKLNTRIPSADYTALYGAALAASGVNAGVAASMVFTNGLSVFTITMPKVSFPKKSPNIAGKTEEFMPLEVWVMKSGASTPSVTMSQTPGP